MITIYTRKGCQHCDEVRKDIKSDKITIIDIDSDDYKGFIPPNVPVAQINGLNLEGAHVINTILGLLA